MNGVMDRIMSFSPWTKPRWTTQMDYPSNFTNPSMFFRFVFVSHNEHHEIQAIILEIQNPSFEIQRGPSDVTFFNIGHEVRREIGNMKCPLVLIQIDADTKCIYRTCTSILSCIVYIFMVKKGKPFFPFFSDFLLMSLIFYHGDLLQQ